MFPQYIIESARMNIEGFRKLARHQGIDLTVHQMVCLPQDIKKYIGSIFRYQKKGGSFMYGACIQFKDLKCSATFQTEDEAKQYICNLSLMGGVQELPLMKLALLLCQLGIGSSTPVVLCFQS